MRRALLSFLMLIAVIHPSFAFSQGESKPTRVLFVGNSLTYVGNLPAVLQHLATANHKPMEVDMIVKGGATLTGRVVDGSVERALQAKHYDYLILQERGGDALGAFGDTSQSKYKAPYKNSPASQRCIESRPFHWEATNQVPK